MTGTQIERIAATRPAAWVLAAFTALVERENADRVRAYNVDRIAAALGIRLSGPAAAGVWHARIHGYPDAAEGHTPAEAVGNLLRAVMIDDPAVLCVALAPW